MLPPLPRVRGVAGLRHAARRERCLLEAARLRPRPTRLDGQEGARRDMVLLNTAAAFVAAGLDQDLKDGIKRAKEVIDSGQAKKKLEQLIEFTNSVRV